MEAGGDGGGVRVPDAQELKASGVTAGEGDARLREPEDFCQECAAGSVGRTRHRWSGETDGDALGT